MLASVALLVLCVGSSPAATRPDDYVARAREFIRIFYPGLNGSLKPVITDWHNLSGPDVLNFFTIELFDLEPKDTKESPACWCSNPQLNATFTFDWQTAKKELVVMAAGGPIAEGRQDKLAEEVNKHPKWSDAQIIAALNAAGPKFGPDHKAEFLRALPIEKLKPFLGGEIEVLSAEFSLRYRTFEEAHEASLSWIVQTTWRSSDGREATCNLAFEPFDGHLTSLMRVPVPPKDQAKPGRTEQEIRR